jgi:hypothetical protein
MAEVASHRQTRANDGLRANHAGGAEARQAATIPLVAPAAIAAGASGCYAWKQPGGMPFGRSELRLDVDGIFPLQVASGSEFAGLAQRVDWMARPLTAESGPEGVAWVGPISYTNGDTFLFQYSSVRVERNGQLMRLTLRGGGPDLVRDYKLASAGFRRVEFEFDAVEGVTPVTSIHTHDHPDRPGSLPDEELSVETIYRRAGFDVRMSGGDSAVPLSLAGADERWSNAEMHDAMQAHWSRFANKPQWSFWTLFAALHEDGPSLGGIMFDDIGPNERQGTSLFLKSFIADAPTGDAAAEAWVRRMAFWTAVHEMGHAFNLAHAWQKDLSSGPLHPWMPMASGYDQLTFMNYPYLYRTGSFSDANTITFFREFDFRFTDEELLFLRHAPERFVEMGNAAWFDNHGFAQAEVSPAPQFRLAARVNRAPASFDYLEPVVVELKLTNLTDQPCLVPDMLLRLSELLTVVVKRGNEQARRWQPHAHQCWRIRNVVLEGGDSLYESLFLSAGHGGWLISEPGLYRIHACIRLNGEDVVSEPLTIRVAPPRSYDEECVAQDLFTEDVGRALAFDGSQVLTSANNALREVAQRFPRSRAAIHAQVALGMPRARPYKLYEPPGQARGGGDRRPLGRIQVLPTEEESVRTLATALGTNSEAAKNAAQALGHIDYRYYAEHHVDALERRGDKREGQEARQVLYETLVDRQVLGRVVDEVRKKLDAGEDEERRGGRGTRRGR